LRSGKKTNLLSSLIAAGLEKYYLEAAEVNGLENLPEEGPFIVLANHFNVKETEAILSLLKDYDAHIVASKKVHGEHPFRKIGLSILRGISSPESLANLSVEEKQALLDRIPDDFIRQKYEEVIEREESGDLDKAGLLQFVKGSVALLTRGDVLVVYPEGLWLYDGESDAPRSRSMYKGYGGFDIIAKQYQKLTGKDVPIVPMSVFEEEGNRKISIGTPKTTNQNDSDFSDVDWYMHQIADMLPEDQRGYYSTKDK
jgi:1-acyl-sn-glycerol-3-phosphate acyltransferase